MKRKLLFAMLCIVSVLGVKAQTDEQYDAAIAVISDGNYGITAVYGGKTYVLQANGRLTDDAYEAATFAVSQTAGGEIKDTGLRIAATGRFTNGGNNSNVITSLYNLAVSTNDRTTFERQVPYRNDEGLYALRATNSTSPSWGASAYWTVVDDNDADGLPNATYSFDDVDFVWNFVPEAEFDAVKASVSAQCKVRVAAQLQAYVDDATYTARKSELSAAISVIEAAATPEDIHNAVLAANKALDIFLMVNSASVKAPFNVAITNPTPLTKTGWEGTNFGTASDGVCEYWNVSGADFHQTLANLPAGHYILKAEALTREGMVGTLYAGDASMNIATVSNSVVDNRAQAAAWFNGGNGQNVLQFHRDADGDLTIGLTADNTTGDHWTVWRSFQLSYYGEIEGNFPFAQVELAAAANRLAEVTEGTIPAAAYSALTATVAEKEVYTYATEEEYLAAAAAINAAVDAAKALPWQYAHYKAKKAAAEAVPSTATYTGDATVDLTAAEAAVEAATTVEAIQAAEALIEAAVNDFLAAVTLDADQRFDITKVYLENPDFEEAAANNTQPRGWTVEKTGAGNYGQQSATYTNSTTEPGVKISHFIEAWAGAYPTTLGKGEIRQTATALPEGLYVLEADVNASHDGSAEIKATDDLHGATLFVRSLIKTVDGENMSNTHGQPRHYSVDFPHAGEGSVDFGLRVAADNNVQWLGADNFKLYYAGPMPLSEYEELLDAAYDELMTFGEDVPQAASDAAEEVMDKVDTERFGYTTKEDYREAITALNARLEANKELVAPYAAYFAARDKYEDISSDIDFTAADAAAEASLTEAELQAAQALLRTAAVAYLATVEDKIIDLTETFVANAGFELGNVNGWTNSGTQAAGAQSNAAFDNKQGSFYAERWHAAGTVDLNQTLADMPAGVYEISAYLYTDTPDGKFYANDVVTAFSTSKKYTILLEKEEAGDIKLGASCTLTASTWICLDGFNVTFLGTNPVGVFRDKLQAAIDEGRTAVDALAVPTGVKDTFAAVADAEEAAKAGYTFDECKTAIATIEAAVADAQAAVAPAAANAGVLAKATATAALPELGEAAKAALQTVIDGNAAALDACANVAAIEAQAAALWAAIGEAIETIALTGDEELDLTYLLTNPDLTSFANWTQAEGWYTDQPAGGNSQVMTNDAATSEDGTKTKFFEYWTPNTARANDQFALYQKVTLPEGTYSISCYAFAQDQFAGQNVVGVYFYANDTKGSAVTTARLTEAQIDFVNTEAQEVKIGLKTVNPNTYNWMGIGYVTLKKVAKKTIEISENVDYVPASAAGDVKVTRELKAGQWNTLVLPFEVTEDELKAALGDDVQVAEESETAHDDLSTINFNTLDVPAITANKPVLVKVGEAVSEFTVENRTIAVGDAKVAGTNFDFVGVYAAQTVAEGDYFLNADKLFQSTGATTVKGTHAYLQAKAASVRAELFIDGVATAIEGLNIEAQKNGAIYNLSGQRVGKAQKGIYVIGGKKVVVK